MPGTWPDPASKSPHLPPPGNRVSPYEPGAGQEAQ